MFVVLCFAANDGKCEAQTIDSNRDTVEGDTFPVRCPCGMNEDDGLMILCDVCSNWQHAVSNMYILAV